MVSMPWASQWCPQLKGDALELQATSEPQSPLCPTEPPALELVLVRAVPRSVASCIRRFCMICQGLGQTARGAYDCESAICPLYTCSPFRRERRRRSSRAAIRRQCEQCQPGDRTDCLAVDCELYPWRPWQPGGQPKARCLTDAQKGRLARVGRATQFGGAR
jgi:hypothetical protein